MATIGEINKLKVLRKVEFGVYLDGENLGDILLPNSFLPDECEVDDIVEVFISFDSEDRIIATTEKPLVTINKFAYLKCVSVTEFGAFLFWGLNKDLFVPFSKQKKTMEEGKSYVVYVYYDKISDRIAATTKIDNYVDLEDHDFIENQLVDLLICYKTDLGYKALINNSHYGVLYTNELFKPLNIGDRIEGYIKKIRDDKKIDLSLTKSGIEKVADFAQLVFDKIVENDGFLKVTDKTPANEIYDIFGISKKNYKKAVGALYKRRMILIEDEGLKSIKE